MNSGTVYKNYQIGVDGFGRTFVIKQTAGATPIYLMQDDCLGMNPNQDVLTAATRLIDKLEAEDEKCLI